MGNLRCFRLVAAVSKAAGSICEQAVSVFRSFGEKALFSGETRLLASPMCGRRRERGDPALPPPSLCVRRRMGLMWPWGSCLKLTERLPLCSSPLWTKLHPSGVLVPEEVLAPGVPGRLERELREGGLPGHGLQVSVGPVASGRGCGARMPVTGSGNLRQCFSLSPCPPPPKVVSFPKLMWESSRGTWAHHIHPCFPPECRSLVSVAPATQPALTSTLSGLLRTIQHCGRQAPGC